MSFCRMQSAACRGLSAVVPEWSVARDNGRREGGEASTAGRGEIIFSRFFFFFSGGNQNKSEWHLDRRAASRRERAASWLTKNEFCLRSALK